MARGYRTPQIIEAADLMRENPNLSIRAAAEAVGINESTLRSGLRRLESQGDRNARAAVPEPDRESAEPNEIPVVIRDYSDQEKHYVYPLGDVHKGSPDHARDRWNEWLGYLERTEGTSMLGTGDFFNAALRTSVSDIYAETMNVEQAQDELETELGPLAAAGRLDLLLPGNHEARIWKAAGYEPVRQMSKVLRVPYAKSIAVVLYRVGDEEYSFVVRHGHGGGSTVGAKANRLEKQARTIEAEVYISGHTHTQQVFPQQQFYLDRSGQVPVVRRRTAYFVSSGSFLWYEPYGAEAGYAPVKVGAPRIYLDGRRHDIHISI